MTDGIPLVEVKITVCSVCGLPTREPHEPGSCSWWRSCGRVDLPKPNELLKQARVAEDKRRASTRDPGRMAEENSGAQHDS
jgi:hypothetical protein